MTNAINAITGSIISIPARMVIEKMAELINNSAIYKTPNTVMFTLLTIELITSPEFLWI